MNCGCRACSSCAKKDAIIKIKYADGGLKRWFKERWTDEKGNECGSGKTGREPKCRPSKRISDKTPKIWGEMTKGQKSKAVAEKRKATKQGKQFSDYKLKRKG